MEKAWVRAVSYTLGNPGAVMIHLEHASIASAAMVGPVRLRGPAGPAPLQGAIERVMIVVLFVFDHKCLCLF